METQNKENNFKSNKNRAKQQYSTPVTKEVIEEPTTEVSAPEETKVIKEVETPAKVEMINEVPVLEPIKVGDKVMINISTQVDANGIEIPKSAYRNVYNVIIKTDNRIVLGTGPSNVYKIGVKEADVHRVH